MSLKVEFTDAEALAVIRTLREAEKAASQEWDVNPTIQNRQKFEALESARLRISLEVLK